MRKLFVVAEDYQLVSQLFLKALAVIYFSAFLSLAVQITGLAGPNGILPLVDLQQSYFQHFGSDAFWRLPTVFWLNAGDSALLGSTIAGCLFSVLLLFGIRERLSLVVLFVLYLSLTTAGQIFLNFQWDYLLLEAGFLAIFLPGGATHLVVFMFHWLLFRLRFLSGISKVLSDDAGWRNWTALQHYFETQPLPHFGGWIMHQLPEKLLQAGVGFTYFTELIVPFFIFLPRRFRLFAAAVTITMQLLIIATSNHNFINVLTILLCLFLIDDRVIRKFTGASEPEPKSQRKSSRVVSSLVAAVLIFSISLPLMYEMLLRKPSPVLSEWSNAARRFGVGNVYHVFPTMQRERHELIIQGSHDGNQWRTYQFKHKPGDLTQLPSFIVPHQPRLDWMIWFVPRKHESSKPWFNRFMAELHKGNPTVTGLLAENPFPNRPPAFMRVLSYRYHFNSFLEQQRTGDYWRRELIGEFPNVPPRIP